MTALGIETKSGVFGVRERTAYVIPIQCGLRYYFPQSSFGGSWRPYGVVAVGPYIGTESETLVGLEIKSTSKTRGAFGGRLGLGLDIQLSRLFMLGIMSGYDLMTDFSEPIGERVNYSGPQFMFSFSVLLGGASTRTD
jgi:hypothetical protein